MDLWKAGHVYMYPASRSRERPAKRGRPGSRVPVRQDDKRHGVLACLAPLGGDVEGLDCSLVGQCGSKMIKVWQERGLAARENEV